MKKALKLVTAAALLAALSIPVAGCSFLKSKNVEKISPAADYTPTYSSSIKQGWSVNTKNTSISFIGSDTAGTAIVRETKTEDGDLTTTYRLFDLTTGTLLNGVSSENTIYALGKGFFYSIQDTDSEGDPLDPSKWTYTLYNRDSVLASDIKGTLSYHMFTQEDGTRWYVDHKGTIQKETNPFAMLFTNYDVKVADKYITLEDDYVFYVYDEDGAFEKAFSIYDELNISENAEVGEPWLAGDNLFVQVVEPLPFDAKDYDFYADAQKFDVKTYSYSVKKDKVKEIKDFDYLVDDYYDNQVPMDYAILEVYKIVDQRISEDYIIQSFDENGNVYLDIQNLVPGAQEIDYCGDYVLIYDRADMTHVYKEKELVITIPSGDIDFHFTNSSKLYYTIGNRLYIYDLDTKSVVKSIASVTDCGITAQDNIWYTVYDETNETVQYNVYNVNSGSTTLIKTMNEEKESLIEGNFGSSYYIIASSSDDGRTYTLSFPDSANQDITSKVGISRVGQYSSRDVENMTYTSYTIFSVQSKKGDSDIINNYYVLVETEAIVEKD